MSKKKITEKKQIKRSESHITNEVAIAVQEFTNIQHGMTMVEIIEKAQLILNECGPDATIEVNYSDYWGSSVELFWHRLETDEEVTKRLEKSEKA